MSPILFINDVSIKPRLQKSEHQQRANKQTAVDALSLVERRNAVAFERSQKRAQNKSEIDLVWLYQSQLLIII